MLPKKVAIIVIFIFSSFLFSQKTEYRDPIAYKSGELVAELTFEAWVQSAKEKKEAIFPLAQKIAFIGQEYSNEMHESFLLGYKIGLENKNVDVHLAYAQLTNLQAALVLACYYYWILLLGNVLQKNTFEFLYSQDFEKEALEKACVKVYGSLMPEIISELKKTLERDR